MAAVDDASEQTSESFVTRLLQAGFDLDQACTPFICLLGALGNSLSLALFSLDPNYRRLSSAYYLSALAISDTGFLLNLFAVWLENVYGGVITSPILCPLVMYLGQVTCFVSIYLMVGFSIERYVAVHYPLARRRICTKSRAKKGIIGITLVALLLFSYAWVIAKVIEFKPNPDYSDVQTNTSITWKQNNFSENLTTETERLSNYSSHFQPDNFTNEYSTGMKHSFLYCSVPEEYYFVSQIANYIDTGITLIIPFLLITYCNVSIARALCNLRNERQLILANPASPSCSINASVRSSAVTVKNDSSYAQKNSNSNTIQTPNLNTARGSNSLAGEIVSSLSKPSKLTQKPSPTQLSGHQRDQSSSEIRATKLLLLVSTVFLVLNLPLHVIRCAQFVQSLAGSQEEKDVFAALQPWANLLFNMNFAVNFFFYCLSGKNFRRSFKHTVSTLLGKFMPQNSAQQNGPTRCRLQNFEKAEKAMIARTKRHGLLPTVKTDLQDGSERMSTWIELDGIENSSTI